MRLIAALPLIAFSYCLNAFAANSLTLSAEDRTDLALTLYTDNLAFVQDSRTLPALANDQTTHLSDISRLMEVESLQIRNAGKIKEQTLNQATVSFNTLLEQHIGKRIQLKNDQASQADPLYEGILLNVENNTALVKIDQRIETIPLYNQWRIIFPNISEDLLLKPSLTFKTEGTTESQTSSLNYLTQGLSWKMDYVATFNDDHSALLLDGLASMSNNTGTDFNNARIRLLAGDVNQSNAPRFREKVLMMAAAPAESDNQVARESLNDFQLYTLPNRVSLADQQQTQVSLLHAETIKVDSKLRYNLYIHGELDQTEDRIKPDSFISFINNQHYGIGEPLPAGQVRFFSPDKKGDLHFVGTDNIGQTAIGQPVELTLGKSFDVTIKKQQTDYQASYDGSVVAYELRIKNSGSTNQEIEITSQFGQPWKLVSSSTKPSAESASEAKWTVKLPGKSDTVLAFRVRITPRKS